jgi:hypothetical protein
MTTLCEDLHAFLRYLAEYLSERKIIQTEVEEKNETRI